MRGLAAALVIAGAAFAADSRTPMVDDPAAPAAADGVRVVDVVFVDETRATPAIGGHAGSSQRELVTTVYVPAAAEPAPLIVLAHGLDGHPRKFTELATFWARAGYVVAVPRFPVSNDEFVVTDGGSFFNERIADLEQQALDVSFVIDEVLALNGEGSGDVAGRVDPERIGLFGLSLGSLTVWTTVLDPDIAETRVDALIQSDGGVPGGIERLAGVTFPVFMAQSDTEILFTPEMVLPQYAAVPTAKYLFVMHGAAHAAVAENTPTPADEAYRVATTVFWDRHLGGRPDEPFPDTIVLDGITSLVEG